MILFIVGILFSILIGVMGLYLIIKNFPDHYNGWFGVIIGTLLICTSILIGYISFSIL